MLEVTGDDIAALSDDDLRTLVGRLCEADLRRRNLTLSSITWGGNQTAKDGGLDVRVALDPVTSIDGFIPKAATGFQVKKQDMPRAAIIKEMKPKGIIRPAILELSKASGAYVIVSSAGSTSDSALQGRKAAMLEALRGVRGAGNLTLDFYDRNRIATWVRDHAGLILWIRSRIGRSLSGWRAYGSWSHAPEGVEQTYLVDEAARVTTGDKDDGDGLSATDGINKIRDALRMPGRVVRLVGLSGVGKTRLAEALFDPAVGTNSLDSSLAIYTDVAEAPTPAPVGLTSDLIASRTRAILVIDNCAPDLHRQLADLVRSDATTVSVITIEYDIREDQPEGTEVFKLDTSSPALIETLVSKRFPDLSQINARTIAESSGGNARVALALAGIVRKNETISQLSDADLFRRLFQQRHDPDASLLAIAQACSLVYSFDGETTSGEDAELAIIGRLIGKAPAEVFSAVAELKRRDLLQRRGPWRAVLPHAIANRLAATALESIPAAAVQAGLIDGASERLLRSFSRRLGYLESSKEAQAIVQGWLAPGGLLANVANLNELGRAMFGNVAPVIPEATLSSLERVLASADDATVRDCTHFVPLVQSLAYDAGLFERAVALLVKFARLSREDRTDRSRPNVFEPFFHIVLSGTHAPLELRLSVVDGLSRSADSTTQDLGVTALGAMLKSNHFTGSSNYEFGARSRDYGYHPKTRQEVRDWFAAVLRSAEPLALSDNDLAEKVRTAIGQEFRGLWTNSDQLDLVDQLARAIAAKRFWREGWIAARQTRIYDGGGLSADDLARLTALEELLRPKELVNKVRGIVINSNSGSLDLEDLDDVQDHDYAAAAARSAAVVESLGRDVAIDEEAFKTLIPELAAGTGKVAGFGRGMALGAENPRRIWTAMVTQLATTLAPTVDFLCGFIAGVQERDEALADALLDEALIDATLARWFPLLQRSAVIDAKALERLHRALELGSAPIATFFNLAYGGTCESISGPEFNRLVLAIGSRPDGLAVAVEILSMRFHSDRNAKRASVLEAVDAGKWVLTRYQFHRMNGRAVHEDYSLATIIRSSLVDDDAKPIVRRLCGDFVAAIGRYDVYAHDYGDSIGALFEVHPFEMLDQLFSGDQKSQSKSVHLLNDLAQFRANPLHSAADDSIIAWCDRDPRARYPVAAAIALLFKRPGDNAPYEWTSLTQTLLVKAPDPQAVIKEIVHRLDPTSWSGSLATKLESRLRLLERLDLGTAPGLLAVHNEAKTRLKQRVEVERRREIEEDRTRSGRFE